VLDVGTGTGAIPRTLAEAGVRPAEAIGVDASAAMLNQARKAGLPESWSLERADARNLPFDEDRFEVVFAAYLLNVLSDADAEAALREMRRVAGPAGRVVVVTPVAPRSFLGRPYELLARMLERRLPRSFGGIRLLEPEPRVRTAGLEPQQRCYVRAGYPSVCLLARVGASR
jgi:ubiquinone/menaquinone biosynthesis C-methylase UbiE